MSTQPPPLEPIYCRKCKALIKSEFNHCGYCGWDQSRSYALAEIEAQEAEAQQRRLEWEAQQAENRRLEGAQRAQADEARRQALYAHATGQGVCPQCKSPNVQEYTYREGGSTAGQSTACCLGCFFSPLAWLAIPFLQGKKKRAFECQYCSNRWSL